MNIGQDHKTFAGQDFRCLQGFSSIGQKVTGIGMNLQFDPGRLQSLPRQSRRKDGFPGRSYPRSIGQQTRPGGADLCQQVVLPTVEFHPFECYSNQLTATGRNGFGHLLVGTEFSGTGKETAFKACPRNSKFFHNQDLLVYFLVRTFKNLRVWPAVAPSKAPDTAMPSTPTSNSTAASSGTMPPMATTGVA